MPLKNLFLLIVVFFFSIGTSFSQKINRDSENTSLPKSIYSLNISTEINSLLNVKNNLNSDESKFVFLDLQNISEGYFTIPLKNIAKRSDFIFKTYKDKYDRQNLEKSFFDLSKIYLPHLPEK
ncbi:hypothetical protein [Lutibacter citreus]|uniref:hypothetical protein n=1 Tax=Lutibacter citreus TaxID=2138210 RepID=UPI000DBE9C3A|nr:hypothetical protein [Lutibacter citreus]